MLSEGGPITLAALADYPNWVAWQPETRDGRATKIPYNPRTGRRAESDDPGTWATHDEALRWAEAHGAAGAGIMLSQIGDKLICGIDLDTCRDRTTGAIEPWARGVIDRFATYTEVSPSGTGMKLFLTFAESNLQAVEALFEDKFGRMFKRANGSDHPPAIEIYRGRRYFAVTWESCGETDELRTVSLADLEWLIREAGPRFKGEGEPGPGNRQKDDSRSGKAFRAGAALKAGGATYEEMRDALIGHEDPEIADWARTKGLANGEREMRRIYDNARTPSKPDEPPPRIVCPTIFQGREPPPRFWIVPDWIPHGVVTGLYGDGGVGKSLLIEQLQTGTALGSAWLGLPVEIITSLGVYCEDEKDELERRQYAINRDYATDYNALGRVHWMPRLGEDNLLMTFTRNGVGELTKFHKQALEAALDLGAKLVIIDTAADTFGGNENDRGQVRQYVQRALGQIALKIDGAVVCCAHPSRAGLNSGTGDSGSTGWNAAFRSRLYLSHEGGDNPDPDIRILERMKANYAAKNDQLSLRWRNGVIIPSWVTETGAPFKPDAKTVFLDLLREMDGQRRPVSSSKMAWNYAPRLFGELPSQQRGGLRRADFDKAMSALFAAKKITNVPYGRKHDERTKIAICEI